MASIFKPTYIDPKTGQRKKSLTYRISYKDETGRRRSVAGFRDKEATKAKAAELERTAERMRAGLPVANHSQRQRPVGDLFDQWEAELLRLGRTRVHIKEQMRLLKTLKKELPMSSLADFRVDRLTQHLAVLQKQGRSPRTLNAYRDALSTFFVFCKRQGWLEQNPLEGFPKAQARGKKAKPRRAYTPQEFVALLAVAANRRLTYLTAGLSGLRKTELRRLEKRDLSPTLQHPRLHLRAEITKAKRREELPMLPELANELTKRWEALPLPTSRVFPRIPRTATINADLDRAGIPKIDQEGRAVDFHSLRYFFCTLLARHLPIQTVKMLMRHRDIRQTCNLYMDLGLTDVAEATLRLPRLLQLPHKPEGEQEPTTSPQTQASTEPSKATPEVPATIPA